MSKINLQSSINKVGKTVTQIFHFSNGNKRTFSGLIPTTIRQGEFTKIEMANGEVLSVNPNNVDCFETFPEGVEIPEEDLEETGGSALETMSRMEAEIRNLNSQLQAFKEAFESLGQEEAQAEKQFEDRGIFGLPKPKVPITVLETNFGSGGQNNRVIKPDEWANHKFPHLSTTFKRGYPSKSEIAKSERRD